MTIRDGNRECETGRWAARAGAGGCVVALTILLAAPAMGQSQGKVSGIFTYRPQFGLSATFDDNIYTVPSDGVDSLIWVQTPGIVIEIEPRQHKFELEYSGTYGQYMEDSTDNYMDHLLAGRAFLALGTRHKIDFDASMLFGHTNRGSGLTRGLGPGDPEFPRKPDEFSDSDIGVLYTFGAPGAAGRIEFGLGTRDREYDKQRADVEFYDRQRNSVSLAFYYGIRTGTYLFIEGRSEDVDYDIDRVDEPTRNGVEQRIRAGVTWEPTGKTRGRFSIGRVSKEFDETPGFTEARADFFGVSWEGDIRYSPKKYSHIDLKTSREPQETIADGDFIDIATYELSWTHDWSDAWRSRMSFGLRNEDFVGTARQEDLKQWNFELRYQMRRWLALTAGLVKQTNDSSSESLEFDATIVSLGFVLAP